MEILQVISLCVVQCSIVQWGVALLDGAGALVSLILMLLPSWGNGEYCGTLPVRHNMHEIC